MNADPLAEWLVNLDDENYIMRESEKVFVQFFRQISVEAWIKLFLKYPAFLFESTFTHIGQLGQPDSVKHLLEIMRALHTSDNLYKPFLQAQTAKLPSYLEKLNLTAISSKAAAKAIVRDSLYLSESQPVEASWISQMAKALTRRLDRTFVNDVLVAVLLEQKKEYSLRDHILKIAVNDLKKRVVNKPSPPADWSRDVPASTGRDSKIWKILTDFLLSPTEQIFDYRKPQADRSDMEAAIRSVTIDLKMETIRKGSPHTLRITKRKLRMKRSLPIGKKMPIC